MSLIETSTSINAAKENKKILRVAPNIIIPGQTRGREVVKDYNQIDLSEGVDTRQAKLESWIAKTIGGELMNYYPNRQWGVKVDIDGGMLAVLCPSLSKEKGYHIHLEGKTMHQLIDRAKMGAGEILERYGITRNRYFNPDHLETLDRDVKDEVLSPDSAPDPIQKEII